MRSNPFCIEVVQATNDIEDDPALSVSEKHNPVSYMRYCMTDMRYYMTCEANAVLAHPRPVADYLWPPKFHLGRTHTLTPEC